MTRVLVLAAGAALSALLAFCESPAKPSVGVFLDFDSVPGTNSVEIMKHEVDHLLKPSGVSVDWRLAADNHGSESFTGLVVMKFKGKCKVEEWQQDPIPGSTSTLGATQVSEGHV